MHPPVRVLQLVLSLAIGGTEKLVYDLMHRIDKRSVTPIACCLDEFGPFGETLRQDGYQVYQLNRDPGLDWSLIHQLHLIIQQEQIDVIHAHQYSPYFYGVLASLYHKLKCVTHTPKLVFTEHGRFYPDRKSVKRMVMNPVFSLFTDEIITISEQTKHSLIRFENFPARRIKVVYNGIDLSVFSQQNKKSDKQLLGLPSDAQVIGIVARLDPIKNHAMLLRAFQKVVEKLPDTYLVIVGDGAEEGHLKSLAASLGIRGQTLFLGARRDVPELLREFDLFALSSFSEGTSVTLLEAMGVGLPIVATRVGGNPEVVKDQETGYLVTSDNDREMTERLLQLLRDPKTREKMGTAGRSRVHSMFSLDKMVNAYTDFYLEVSSAR